MPDENMETVETTEQETETVEETIEETTETTEEREETEEGAEEQGNEEEETFDPDKLEFGEEEVEAKFGDYDLSNFKDRINFENEQVRQLFSEKATELKEQGFNQQQVEYLLNKEIEYVLQNKESQKLSKEKVMEELKKSLTVQERKDYKAVGGYLKEITQGDEQLSKVYAEAMSNPVVYKLLHRAFSKSLGGKSLGIGTTKDTKETREQGITFEKALNDYTEYLQKNIGNKEDRKPYINELMKKLSKADQEKFKNTFGL